MSKIIKVAALVLGGAVIGIGAAAIAVKETKKDFKRFMRIMTEDDEISNEDSEEMKKIDKKYNILNKDTKDMSIKELQAAVIVGRVSCENYIDIMRERNKIEREKLEEEKKKYGRTDLDEEDEGMNPMKEAFIKAGYAD